AAAGARRDGGGNHGGEARDPALPLPDRRPAPAGGRCQARAARHPARPARRGARERDAGGARGARAGGVRRRRHGGCAPRLGDGRAYGVEVTYVRQPRPDGSADAVRRAVEAGATPPLVVSGADKLYAPGTARAFAEAFRGSGSAAALAIEPDGRPAPLWGLA